MWKEISSSQLIERVFSSYYEGARECFLYSFQEWILGANNDTLHVTYSVSFVVAGESSFTKEEKAAGLAYTFSLFAAAAAWVW